jgi:hypothetical protein
MERTVPSSPVRARLHGAGELRHPTNSPPTGADGVVRGHYDDRNSGRGILGRDGGSRAKRPDDFYIEPDEFLCIGSEQLGLTASVTVFDDKVLALDPAKRARMPRTAESRRELRRNRSPRSQCGGRLSRVARAHRASCRERACRRAWRERRDDSWTHFAPKGNGTILRIAAVGREPPLCARPHSAQGEIHSRMTSEIVRTRGSINPRSSGVIWTRIA